MTRTNAVLGAGTGASSRPQQYLDRNRAISAAYAELAQGDGRMRWAGIASVVSTQAQCAMEHANTAVARSDTARAAVAYMPGVSGEAARQTAGYVYDSAVEVQRQRRGSGMGTLRTRMRCAHRLLEAEYERGPAQRGRGYAGCCLVLRASRSPPREHSRRDQRETGRRHRRHRLARGAGPRRGRRVRGRRGGPRALAAAAPRR